jgi:hypothetical protein
MNCPCRDEIVKIFRKKNLWLGLVVGTLGFVGCKSANPLDKATVESIAKARSVALTESTKLDEESRKLISDNIPERSYYRLAGDFAQYSFSWEISSNRTLIVYGDGDIKTLENHKIIIRLRMAPYR